MTFIDAESNSSQITCIMVVVESDWMWIQNLPNRIRCGVKKDRVRTSLMCRTTMTVLLERQTQRFIRTVSLPADFITKYAVAS